jgi:hypothetical protein
MSGRQPHRSILGFCAARAGPIQSTPPSSTFLHGHANPTIDALTVGVTGPGSSVVLVSVAGRAAAFSPSADWSRILRIGRRQLVRPGWNLGE